MARSWMVRDSNPGKGKISFFFFKTVQTCSGSHPAPYSVATRDLSLG